MFTHNGASKKKSPNFSLLLNGNPTLDELNKGLNATFQTDSPLYNTTYSYLQTVRIKHPVLFKELTTYTNWRNRPNGHNLLLAALKNYYICKQHPELDNPFNDNLLSAKIKMRAIVDVLLHDPVLLTEVVNQQNEQQQSFLSLLSADKQLQPDQLLINLLAKVRFGLMRKTLQNLEEELELTATLDQNRAIQVDDTYCELIKEYQAFKRSLLEFNLKMDTGQKSLPYQAARQHGRRYSQLIQQLRTKYQQMTILQKIEEWLQNRFYAIFSHDRFELRKTAQILVSTQVELLPSLKWDDNNQSIQPEESIITENQQDRRPSNKKL